MRLQEGWIPASRAGMTKEWVLVFHMVMQALKFLIKKEQV